MGGKLPANAQLISAKGYRKNGNGTNIYKYRLNDKIYVMWIPVGGGAA